MAGVKTLADGNVKVVLLPAAPADINAVTVTEALAGEDLSCNILSSDFDLGPTGSDTVAEKPLCATGNGQVFGPSNYAGGFTVFRYFDPATGAPDATDDWAWEAVREKGTTLHLLVRETAKLSTADFAATDEYRYYEAVSDDPVRGERTGFVKWRINLAVQNAALDKAIAAAG